MTERLPSESSSDSVAIFSGIQLNIIELNGDQQTLFLCLVRDQASVFGYKFDIIHNLLILIPLSNEGECGRLRENLISVTCITNFLHKS